MLPAALAQALTADGVVFTGRGLLRGWSVLETGGTNPASLVWYDAGSTSDTAKPVGMDAVAKSSADTQILGPAGVALERGLVLDLTGAATVVAYYNTETRVGDQFAVFADGTTDLTALALARLIERLT